jgi:hypothetical protein
VIPLLESIVVIGCVAAVLLVGIWTALFDRPPRRSRRPS